MSAPVILVPLDGSESALAALPVAKVLGKIDQSVLCLVHVAEREPPDAELVSRLTLRAQDLGGATIEVHIGESAAQILRIAEEIEPRMIALCKHSTGMPREGCWEARQLPCSAARGSAPWHLHPILVPHDGTPRDYDAMDTMTISVADAPRHDEVPLIVAFLGGTRSNARIKGASSAQVTEFVRQMRGAP